MPVPVVIGDLSPVAANNFPLGSNAPSVLDDVQRAHGAFIAQLRDAVMPVGSIVMYNGLVADIPGNWKLCDGTSGTPDLRDKFIVGAGSSYTLAATGGSKDAVVVSHTHSATSAFSGASMADHAHSVSDPGHQHIWGPNEVGANPATGAGYASSDGLNNLGHMSSTSASVTGISISGASAGTPSGSVSTSIEASGGSGSGANLPPFYALMYIRRMS